METTTRRFTSDEAMEAVLECVRSWDDIDLAIFLAECYPGEPVSVGDETRTYIEAGGAR